MRKVGRRRARMKREHGPIWRTTAVLGLFVFGLYFVLLTSVSYLAVSHERGRGNFLHAHIFIKNGSMENGGSRSNGTFRGGTITIDGGDLRYSLHQRTDSGQATDLERSRTIFKCVPVHYRQIPGKIVALASFPGSGNTWLRYLLQLSTGIFTGSVYKDLALLRNGFPGESISNGLVITVKTHESGPVVRGQFDKAILLVRKPSEAILAEFNRRAAGHIGHAGQDKFTRNSGRYWSQFVSQKGKSWTETNLDWIDKFQGPLLIIMYNMLVENTKEELKNILEFLQEDPGNMTCILEHKEGIYRRRKKLSQFNPFTPRMDRFLFNQEKIVLAAIAKRTSSNHFLSLK